MSFRVEGMVPVSSAVALYLDYVGFAGGLPSVLLWPATVLHLVLTALLAVASIRKFQDRAVRPRVAARDMSGRRL
jgi:hypothetical protein